VRPLIYNAQGGWAMVVVVAIGVRLTVKDINIASAFNQATLSNLRKESSY
jgi:hypothetical protein